jgi:CRP-like cAMP-binding protein
MNDVEALSDLYMFRTVSRDHLTELCALAPPTTFQDGHVLFRQGQPADVALLVLKGRLIAEVSGGEAVRTVGDIRPGEIVGERALLSRGGRRSATVSASEASRCLLLSWETFERGTENLALVALEQHLLGSLARRIRATNTVIQGAWKESDKIEAESPSNKTGTLRDRLRTLWGGLR